MVEELANSQHLSDKVSQNLGGGKRNERISATQFTAENMGSAKPPVKKEEKVSSANGEQKKEPTMENPTGKRDSRYEDKMGASNNSDTATYKPASAEDDDKIFGMNKYVFYGGLAVLVAVGGYFLYKKYGKKGATPSVGAGAGTTNATSATATASAGGAIKK